MKKFLLTNFILFSFTKCKALERSNPTIICDPTDSNVLKQEISYLKIENSTLNAKISDIEQKLASKADSSELKPCDCNAKISDIERKLESKVDSSELKPCDCNAKISDIEQKLASKVGSLELQYLRDEFTKLNSCYLDQKSKIDKPETALNSINTGTPKNLPPQVLNTGFQDKVRAFFRRFSFI